MKNSTTLNLSFSLQLWIKNDYHPPALPCVIAIDLISAGEVVNWMENQKQMEISRYQSQGRQFEAKKRKICFRGKSIF